jgi:N-acetylmuramoyl-L-alanine amidase
MLALYGYELDITGDFDLKTRQVVAAFQRHFRPEKVDGVVDQSTIETLHALLRKLPSLSA